MIRNVNANEMFVFSRSRQNALSQLSSRRRRNFSTTLSRLSTSFIALDSTSIATLKTQIMTNNDDDALLLTLEGSVRNAFKRLRNENKIALNKVNDCVVTYVFFTTNNSRTRIKFFAF